MKLTFLGANRQVTGSRYCLEAGGKRLMIDCGLFQEREFLSRNWDRCPVDETEFDAMLLTHIHIDHCGLIPRAVREGFKGPIYATVPSVDLVEIMLLDSARIQEEDAAYKKRRHEREKRKGRYPEVPLYTTEDAERALPLFDPVDYRVPLRINDIFTVTFHDAGHILGSAMLEIGIAEEGHPERTLIFSGDIGQWDRPLVHDPSLFDRADFVVMESTYGDREHIDAGDIEDQLAEIIGETAARGGTTVIPVFAVDRAQQLMYHISRLVHRDRIPDLPVYLDSPMAIDVTEVYRRHTSCLDDEAQKLMLSDEPPLRFPGLRFARSVDESKAINADRGPSVIMSASGMCTAGRIKHHLRNHITDPKNTILFVGFQAHGTLGRQIVEGDSEVRIHGKYWPVKARIAQVQGASAHADRGDLMRWLGGFTSPPEELFLTHGEESAALSLQDHIRETLGWKTSVPEYGSEVSLD